MHSLDSVRLLTAGEPLTLRNLIVQSTPAVDRFGVGWAEDQKLAYSAQVLHQAAAVAGQLNFLAAWPEAELEPLVELLERIIQASGAWQARWLLADLPVDSPFFPAFRRADFNVWATQKVFCFTDKQISPQTASYHWRTWNGNDIRTMTCLHHEIVPRPIQHLEPLTRGETLGRVLYDAHEALLGYADLKYGPRGIWVQAFFTPQAQDPAILSALLASLSPSARRPVFVCARSYQPWLEMLLNRLEASVGPEEALLVRYLVIREKAPQTQTATVFEAKSNEDGLPVAQVQKKDLPGV